MKKRTEREARKIVRDYGLAIGVSIVVALSIRFFVLEAYRMPSRAMQPAVEPGDTLFVSKFSYGLRFPGMNRRFRPSPPEYGDVVVLEFPEEPGREYIKRVIALPGDRLLIQKGALVLNGKVVTALSPENDLCAREKLPNAKDYEVCFEPPALAVEKEITVPPESAYVAGDLRSIPVEGRRLRTAGLVPFTALRGKALFVWLSIQPPSSTGSGGDWFSRIRFDRIFRRIH